MASWLSAGTERKRIIDGYVRLQRVDEVVFNRSPTILGDGNAAGKVVNVVMKRHSGGGRDGVPDLRQTNGVAVNS